MRGGLNPPQQGSPLDGWRTSVGPWSNWQSLAAGTSVGPRFNRLSPANCWMGFYPTRGPALPHQYSRGAEACEESSFLGGKGGGGAVVGPREAGGDNDSPLALTPGVSMGPSPKTKYICTCIIYSIQNHNNKEPFCFGQVTFYGGPPCTGQIASPWR